MKPSTMIIVLFLHAFLANAQVEFLSEIKIEGDFYTTDHLGNIYFAKGSTITRLNSQGVFNGDFRSVFPGNIYHIDATDPLRILLFYRDFNQVLFLDRNMTEKGNPIFLNDLGIGNAELVSASARGGMWILDWSTRQLNYFNQMFSLVFQTSLMGNLTNMDDTPTFMTETDGRLYISFPKNGIVVFDRNGTFETVYPILDAKSFQKAGTSILFIDKQQPSFFFPGTGETKRMELPFEAKFISGRVVAGMLYLFTSGSIFLYKIM